MLQEILAAQKQEMQERLKERYIERAIPETHFSPDMISAILGPRRAGKSFLAIHLMRQSGDNFGYANFDDERLIDVSDYDRLCEAIDAVYDKPRTLLFDEIQNLPRWELFVNRLQRNGYRVVLTGSNAHLLGGELATHLTGRHLPLIIFPFSFPEYASAAGGPWSESRYRELLVRYLREGGFPEPIVRSVDRKAYLTTLFESTIYKDIVRRFRIRSARSIDDLAMYAVSNAASELSANTLTKVTGCKSHHTVEKYLGYLERTLLFFRITRFDYSSARQASYNRKIYCIDNGFISSKGFAVSPNYGKLAENMVAVMLKKYEMEGRCSVFFWKNSQQEEVDFVIKQGPRVTSLIQSCWNLDSPGTRDREIRALLKASRELGCDDLTILTESQHAEEQVQWFGFSGTIKVVPFWKWLIESEKPNETPGMETDTMRIL